MQLSYLFILFFTYHIYYWNGGLRNNCVTNLYRETIIFTQLFFFFFFATLRVKNKLYSTKQHNNLFFITLNFFLSRNITVNEYQSDIYSQYIHLIYTTI